MISTSPDPHLLRRPGRPRPRRGPRAAHARSTCPATDTIRPEQPFGPFVMSLRIAIVGATGAVGTDHAPPRARAVRRRTSSSPFASERSAGKDARRRARRPAAARRHDRGLRPRAASAPAARHRARVGAALRRARRDRGRQLQRVPHGPRRPAGRREVNPEAVGDARKGIIANPNCTTMVDHAAGQGAARRLRPDTRWSATSFQAAGGAGQKGIDELIGQVATVGEDVDQLINDGAAAARQGRAQRPRQHARLQRRAAARHPGRAGLHRRGDEDPQRVAQDPRASPSLEVTPTCVRVPVVVGHSVAVRATFEREVDRDARARGAQRLPEPRRRGRARRRWSGRAATRRSSAACAGDLDDPHALNFFVVGDNLLKGAALNTVQIAELCPARRLHDHAVASRDDRRSP